MKKWFVDVAQKDEFQTMADIDGDGQVTKVCRLRDPDVSLAKLICVCC